MEGDSGDRGKVGPTQTSCSLRRRQSTAEDLSPIHKTVAAHGGEPVQRKSVTLQGACTGLVINYHC